MRRGEPRARGTEKLPRRRKRGDAATQAIEAVESIGNSWIPRGTEQNSRGSAGQPRILRPVFPAEKNDRQVATDGEAPRHDDEGTRKKARDPEEVIGLDDGVARVEANQNECEMRRAPLVHPRPPLLFSFRRYVR